MQPQCHTHSPPPLASKPLGRVFLQHTHKHLYQLLRGIGRHNDILIQGELINFLFVFGVLDTKWTVASGGNQGDDHINQEVVPQCLPFEQLVQHTAQREPVCSEGVVYALLDHLWSHVAMGTTDNKGGQDLVRCRETKVGSR